MSRPAKAHWRPPLSPELGPALLFGKGAKSHAFPDLRILSECASRIFLQGAADFHKRPALPPIPKFTEPPSSQSFLCPGFLGCRVHTGARDQEAPHPCRKCDRMGKRRGCRKKPASPATLAGGPGGRGPGGPALLGALASWVALSLHTGSPCITDTSSSPSGRHRLPLLPGAACPPSPLLSHKAQGSLLLPLTPSFALTSLVWV